MDNLTSAWLPDIHYVYKDGLLNLGLYDNRTILYEQRFMLTNNKIQPKVYQVTKVTDMTPQGMIKLSLKQDELNAIKDNVDLLVCDYYSTSGEANTGEITDDYEQDNSMKISSMFINDVDELEQSEDVNTSLFVGETSYYNVTFSNIESDFEWKVSIINNDDLDEEEIAYYEGLIKMNNFDKYTVSLKPAKARSLVGKKFTLSVSTLSGKYYSSIELEVSE